MNLEKLKLTLPQPRVKVNLDECPCNWAHIVTSRPVTEVLTLEVDLSSWFMTVRRATGATF